MSEPLEILSAKQAILEGLYLYCCAVDRIDSSLLPKVWHQDAIVDYEGTFEGSASDCMELVFAMHRACDATSHQITNAIIHIDDERATSESYVTACVRSGGNDFVVRGRYSDIWSKRNDEWRIDRRHYVQDVMHMIPVAEETS